MADVGATRCRSQGSLKSGGMSGYVIGHLEDGLFKVSLHASEDGRHLNCKYDPLSAFGRQLAPKGSFDLLELSVIYRRNPLTSASHGISHAGWMRSDGDHSRAAPE